MGGGEEGPRANGLLELKRLVFGGMLDMGLLGAKGGRFAEAGERLNPGVDLLEALELERTCPPTTAALGGGRP